MAFMEPQIEHGRWYAVETDNGTDYIPADLANLSLAVGESRDDEEACNAVQDYANGTVHAVSLIEGWGARLSAPGYLDATDWAVLDSEQEAVDYLRDTYGDEMGHLDGLDDETSEDGETPQGCDEID